MGNSGAQAPTLFTQDQLEQLRYQILFLRRVKGMGRQQQVQMARTSSSQPHAYTHRSFENQQHYYGNDDDAGIEAVQQSNEAWKVRRANQPIATVVDLRMQEIDRRCAPVGFDPAEMLKEEAELRLHEQWNSRKRQLSETIQRQRSNEEACTSNTHHPFGESGDKTGATATEVGQTRLAATNELRAMRLHKKQRVVRAQLIREQAAISAMPADEYTNLIRGWQADQRPLAPHKSSAADMHMVVDEADPRRRDLLRTWAALQQRTREMNKLVSRVHDRLAREHAKRTVSLEQQQMDAIKRSDMNAYYQLLQGQQSSSQNNAENADKKYKELENFLGKTEEYLSRLSHKITSVKESQERSEAANAAVEAARARGESEEDAQRAAEAAAESTTDAAGAGKAQNGEEKGEGNALGSVEYYSSAHTVKESVSKQPSMLSKGNLREYQLVGLQWLVSLHNNKLNGILADEMGLGKTLQCIALIAHLWEHKQNHGPHLIVVPNAVMFSWKNEIARWLPRLQAVYYVGEKSRRTEIYSNDILNKKFNVLVTTYELAMKDRARLDKIHWRYLVVDEAHRLKDPSSRLNKELLRLRCERRLLLTGTPLQNDLKELWSLLNLLLPQVFDSARTFEEWFQDQKQTTNTARNKMKKQSEAANKTDEDAWLERERKKIVITRLHQILEPFMLRRVVADVEGKLPPKTAHEIKCPLSAWQHCIYDWVNRTGTLKALPQEDGSFRHNRRHAPVSNKVMDLKKVCNHPRLSYPPQGGGFEFTGSYIVRSCGKLWTLDKMLTKLFMSGHKVLIFSSMTKLLDVLELYFSYRQVNGQHMEYRRIDGSTTFEQREGSITDFNDPETNVFAFLLSIRAAGRGINLQAADTVVLFDPDANPKNEEQAVARAHRIGQDKEVRVFHLESVLRESEEVAEAEDGKASEESGSESAAKYTKSVETLLRDTIQQQKIHMADEVIDAGKFDQQTTSQSRQQELEKLLTERDRRSEKPQRVPGLSELNEMLARGEEEKEYFNRLDTDQETMMWPGPPLSLEEVPSFLRFEEEEVAKCIEEFKIQKMGTGMMMLNAHAAEGQVGRGVRTTSVKSFEGLDDQSDGVDDLFVDDADDGNGAVVDQGEWDYEAGDEGEEEDDGGVGDEDGVGSGDDGMNGGE